MMTGLLKFTIESGPRVYGLVAFEPCDPVSLRNVALVSLKTKDKEVSFLILIAVQEFLC